MMSRLELITLPLRTVVLLFLLWAAYHFGNDNPLLDSRTDTPETGVVANYSRNGRPFRIFYDRDRDKRWDMWIDARSGAPPIVSIDDNGDGQPDRFEDESGRPLSAWQLAQLRLKKGFVEFVRNSRHVQYTGLALLLYILLEFGIRLVTR